MPPHHFMPLPPTRRVAWRLHAGALALAAASAALPALATSLAGSTASSASSAGSASVGSLSDSVQGSSQSSARTVATADGDYRVLAMADAPDHPGQLRLRLAPLAARAGAVGPGAAATAPVAGAEGDADAGELWLRVPRQALAGRALAVGDVVLARQRPYGVAFAQPVAEGGERPFFLALRDDWQGELGARVLHP